MHIIYLSTIDMDNDGDAKSEVFSIKPRAYDQVLALLKNMELEGLALSMDEDNLEMGPDNDLSDDNCGFKGG
jgi:hypothetical protein